MPQAYFTINNFTINYFKQLKIENKRKTNNIFNL